MDVSRDVSCNVDRLLLAEQSPTQIHQGLYLRVQVLLLSRRHYGTEVYHVLVLGTTGGAIIKQEARDWVQEVTIVEAMDDLRALVYKPGRPLTDKQNYQSVFLEGLDIHIHFGPQVGKVGLGHLDSLGYYFLRGSQVGGDLECTLFSQDLIDLDFGMENERAPKDGGDSTVGLGHVAYPVIDIEVWGLAVNPTGLHEPPELLQHLLARILLLGEFWGHFVPISADPIHNHIQQSLFLVQHPQQEAIAQLVLLLVELVIQLLVNVSVFVELIGGVVVHFNLVELVVDLDQLMHAPKQVLPLHQSQSLGVEDGFQTQRHLLQLPIQDEGHLVDNPEVHVLVHVGFLHHLAGETRPAEHPGLDVYVVPSQGSWVLFPSLHLLAVFLKEILRQDSPKHQRGFVLH